MPCNQAAGWRRAVYCLVSASLPLPRLLLPLVTGEVSIPSDSACAVRLRAGSWGEGGPPAPSPSTSRGPSPQVKTVFGDLDLAPPQPSCGSVEDMAWPGQ